MQRPGILTLTTDFGSDGPYVAAMKGVVLGLAPDARLVDVSHAIAPQNVLEGAFVLSEIVDMFPGGTVHLAVVDPGVGTDRRLIAAMVADQWFVLPDNGLISGVTRDRAPSAVWEITNPAIRRATVSATFHGRDILAPAAAHLLNGRDPADLGPACAGFVTLRNFRPVEDADGYLGEVIYRDTFGNLVTNLAADLFKKLPADAWSVEIAGERLNGLARTYGDHASGALIALFGGTGWLEVAVVNGDAAEHLSAGPGTPVRVRKKGRDGMSEPFTPETLREWDRNHLWHPFTPLADWAAADPLIIDHAEGVYLYDIHGRRYLDGVASLWCNLHGHRHPRLDAALREQFDKVAHTTLLGATHAPAVELARRLVERAPDGLNRVFFSDDGATAVEVALKMAFQYWRQKADPEPKRTRFLALGDAYHGDTLGDVSVGGVNRFHAMFSPLLFPALRAPSPNCYRCPLGLERPSCAIACLGEVDRILNEHPGEVAAVIAEPLVQGAAGMIVHPEGYLKGLRDLTRTHHTLLIADEVAVGFGRTGTLFACEQENVTPDFLCLAKGITGGYLPLAATLTTDEVYSAFYGTARDGKTFYHGHTYGGNPLSEAVGLASLRVFDEEKTLDNLRPKVARLAECLARFKDLRHVGDVRQRGLLSGIELVADRASKAPFDPSEQVGARVCLKAREFGLLIRPLGDVLVIMPPLAISADQLDWMVDVMIRCTRIVTEGSEPDR